jgi:hypothetical protein
MSQFLCPCDYRRCVQGPSLCFSSVKSDLVYMQKRPTDTLKRDLVCMHKRPTDTLNSFVPVTIGAVYKVFFDTVLGHF